MQIKLEGWTENVLFWHWQYIQMPRKKTFREYICDEACLNVLGGC